MVRNGTDLETVLGNLYYGEETVMSPRELWIHNTILGWIENDEYKGRRRTPKEAWSLYKRLQVVAAMKYDAMLAADDERVAELELEERNIEDALSREERGEDIIIANYNLEWLNEPIICSKFNTLDNFLHAFEADKATTRLLRRGVWLVPNKNFCAKRSRTKISRQDEVFLDAFIKKLLDAGVIERGRRNGFSAKLKLIPKSNGMPRLIIDYSHLRGILESPPVFLPGILYLIKYHPELFRKFCIKIDITNMFYNAPIIPACRDVTTFEYKGRYWRCSRLPFGIQPAPYFAMRLMKVVLDWIRSKGLACWCHIDDILISGDNRGYLESIGAKVLERFKLADWTVSLEKSVLRPVEQVEYLGVMVSEKGIAQTPKIAKMKQQCLDLLETPLLLSAKHKEIIAGTNNYCNMFIVHNATLNVSILKNVMLVTKNLAKVTYLYEAFVSKSPVSNNGEFVCVVADATDQQMAAIVNNKLVIAKLMKKVHCNTTEILAPLIALKVLNVNTENRNLVIKTDNNTAKSAYKRNRVRLQRKQLSFDIFCEIARLHNKTSSLECVYVKSKENIADYFSRVDFKKFIASNKCEISSVALGDILQVDMTEQIMMRIAIMNCNDCRVYERGLFWRALSSFVDEINEKRININIKMENKKVHNFTKLDAIDIIRT